MQRSTYQDHLAELPACQVHTVGDDWKTIRIAPDGEVTSRKGTFIIDDDSARAIVADFDQHGTPLVIDWEHQTLGGAYSAPDGRAPAAGWIRKLWREAGRGLYALVKWNDKARDAIKAEEYLYLSPVLSIRESDRRAVALHSAALTNKPAIPRMERLAASDRITNTEGNPMATEMTPDVKEVLGKIGVAMQCDVSDDLVGSLNAILAKAQTVMGGDEGTADTAVALAASVRAAFKLNAKAGDEELLATLKWLKTKDDRGHTLLYREGKGAWSHRCTPYNEQDWSAIEPGAMFVADHKQCDFWVQHGNEQIRPWLTAVQDCRSRCIVGWHLGPSPNQDTIMAAMYMACKEWCVPQSCRIDNGRDFKSERLTGLTRGKIRELRKEHGKEWKDAVRRERAKVDCGKDSDTRWHGLFESLGIKVIYALPYSPWSKGTIERWFGTFGNKCAKFFATWCGIDSKSKPECLKDIRAGRLSPKPKRAAGFSPRGVIDETIVPTLDQARETIGKYLWLGITETEVGEFAWTRMAEAIYAVAQYAVKRRKIALFVVSAGSGKSITLDALLREFAGSIKVTVTRGNASPTKFLKSLGEGLRLSNLGGDQAMLQRRIVRALAGTNRPIFIDEAHKLSVPALDVMREVWDATQVPILLAATPVLYSRMTTRQVGTLDTELLDQLSSRVAFYRDLTSLENPKTGEPEPRFNVEDVRKVFERGRVRIARDAGEFLARLANTDAAGGLRTCKDLIQLVIDLWPGEVVTRERLARAMETKLGIKEAGFRMDTADVPLMPVKVATA